MDPGNVAQGDSCREEGTHHHMDNKCQWVSITDYQSVMGFI